MSTLAESVAQVAFFRPIAENNVPHLKKILDENANFAFDPVIERVNTWWAEKLFALTGTRPRTSIQDIAQSTDAADNVDVLAQPMLNETIGVLVQVLSVYLHGALNFSFCVGVSLGHIASLIVSMSASRDELLANIPRGLDVLYFIQRSFSELNGSIPAGRKCMMSVSGKRGSKILNNTIKPVLRDFRNVRVGVVWSQNGLLLSGMPDDLSKIEALLLKKNIKFLYTTLVPVGFPMHNEVYNRDLVRLAHKHIDAADCSHFAYNTPILDLSTAELLEELEGSALIKRIVELICSEPNHVPYIEDGVPVGKRLVILDYGCGGMRGGVIGMIQDAMSNLEDGEYELYNYHFDGCKKDVLALKS